MSSVTGGATNVTRYFKMRLSADGTAATGLTATDFDLQYTRTGAAATAKVDATLNANGVGGAHSDNTVIEVDATSSPGLYRVDFPDAAFAAGVDQVILDVTCATAFGESQAVDIDPPVNATKVSGDSAAADNLELDYDGTGYAKANSTIGTCTTNTDMRGTNSASTHNAAAVVTALLANTPTAGGSATIQDIFLAGYAMARGEISFNSTGKAATYYDDDDATALFTLTQGSTGRTST